MNSEELVKNYRIFVDTCSFMHEGSQVYFGEILKPLLQRLDKKIIVPGKVIEEINKHQKSTNRRVSRCAAIAAEIVNEYIKGRLLDARGEKGEDFADNVFMTVFTKFRLKHNLALITQDRNLAREIGDLARHKSVHTNKKIVCLKLDKRGTISSLA